MGGKAFTQTIAAKTASERVLQPWTELTRVLTQRERERETEREREREREREEEREREREKQTERQEQGECKSTFDPIFT